MILIQEGVYEDNIIVSNGSHYSSSSLASAGSSTSSIEPAVVIRTPAVEPTKSKKEKRHSAHLGSDKYLKSCAMDFQYIEVSGNENENRNGNTYPTVTDSNHHGDVTDTTTTTGHLLSLAEEENMSLTSSSDESSQPITLALALENVIIALEEPQGTLCHKQ